MIRPVGAVVPVPAPTPRLPGGPALVPLGEITCLERVVGLLQQCGLAQVAVVAEAADRPALDLAGRAGALPVIHSGRRGRLARIRTGLTALDPGLRAVFLLPANIPLVRPATIRRLLEAYCAGGPALIRPVCCGRPGWPVLLDAGQIPALIAEFSPGGLHAALARLAEETVAIEVADEYIRLGLSSPADVERLREHLARYGLPTEAELNTLQQRLFPASPGGLAHAQAVARVALTLAQALNAARAGGSEPALDTALVRAAAPAPRPGQEPPRARGRRRPHPARAGLPHHRPHRRRPPRPDPAPRPAHRTRNRLPGRQARRLPPPGDHRRPLPVQDRPMAGPARHPGRHPPPPGQRLGRRRPLRSRGRPKPGNNPGRRRHPPRSAGAGGPPADRGRCPLHPHQEGVTPSWTSPV